MIKEIPFSFKESVGGVVPKKVKLRNCSKKVWSMEMTETGDGLCFQNNWAKLVKDNSITNGDCLFFSYGGYGLFEFVLFDQFGCEKIVVRDAQPQYIPMDVIKDYMQYCIASHFNPARHERPRMEIKRFAHCHNFESVVHTIGFRLVCRLRRHRRPDGLAKVCHCRNQAFQLIATRTKPEVRHCGRRNLLLSLSLVFTDQLVAVAPAAQAVQERERNASDQLQLMAQKQKQTEEEFNRNLAGLSKELSLSNEIRQKLDREVRCLQNENDLLEIQQKELKGTINSILESRESFIKAYEDSTCEMRRAIEVRDRKIEVLSEKLKANSMLFDSIEKEASSIKQIVEDTRNVLSAREEVGILPYIILFAERINNLESELRNKELELRKRDMAILGLKLQVEAADVKREFQPKIEEISIQAQDMSVKELIIQNLTSENKELHFEVASLGVVMKKIQDALSRMNEEDRKTFTIVLECQEEYVASEKGEALRAEDEVQNGEENLHEKSFVTKDNTTSPEFDEGLKNNSLKEDGMSDSYVSEASRY
nr:cingulin isoform X2 [Ipomoea batatas]